MTAAQQAENLERIASASVHIERLHGIPAELACGQCIIESGWLAKSPGNNCFGIKAAAGATHYQTIPTTEYLTDEQLARVRKSGRKITAVSTTYFNGKLTVAMEDRFAVYADLEECFEAYADLLMRGKYFAPRFERFREHGDVVRLLIDMSGADGQPPYFTGGGYVEVWRQIVNQANVVLALADARAVPQAAGRES